MTTATKDRNPTGAKRPVAADFHVTEPPNCYIDHIEAKYRAIVRDGLDAGALGFATSKAPTHVGYEGRPVRRDNADVDGPNGRRPGKQVRNGRAA